MPELVACPSCGCRVQVSEAQLGRRTRCIGCNFVFVAEPGEPAAPAAVNDDPFPLRPVERPVPPSSPRQKGLPRHRLPLCPGCSRPVSWEVFACPYCGHLFDPGDGRLAGPALPRRDGDNHRGGLIDTLGSVCLLAGFLSLCTGPIGLCIALITGVPAWVMASHDLPRMATAEVDPAGRATTEAGRRKAIAGFILAVLFGASSMFVYREFWNL